MPYLYGASGDGFYVRCRDCMVSGPLCAHGNEAIAEWNATWNRRAPSPHGQDVEASLYEIAAKADPSHAWHIPTPDGVCRRCGYDATDPEAREPCRGAALRSRQEPEPVAPAWQGHGEDRSK